MVSKVGSGDSLKGKLPVPDRQAMLELGAQAVKVIADPDAQTLVGRFAKALRNITEGIRPEGNPLQFLRIVAIVNAPASLRAISRSAIELFRNEPGKVDNLLTITFETGNLATYIGATADALGELGVTAQAVAWTAPLNIVGVSLSAVEMLKDAHDIYEAHTFTKINFKQLTGDYQGFAHVVTLLSDKHTNNKKFIAKHFGIKGELMLEHMEKIKEYANRKLKSPLEHIRQEGKKDVQKTSALVRKRIKVQQWTRAYNIVVSIINIIGFAILFTPAAPVGCILIGLSTVMTISRLTFIKRINRQFEQSLQGISMK